MPDKPSPFRARRSFAWRLMRRLRQRATWDYWRAVLATMVWAAPLTLLIWGVAEREQIVSAEAAVRLDPRSNDTTLSVRMPGRARESVRLTFEGPRVGVSTVKEFLAKTSLEGGLTFDVNDALPVGEVSSIDLRLALQDETEFSDNGVRIVSTSPPTIDVFVDRIVPRTWPIMLDGSGDPNLIVTFDPPSATVFGPGRVLDNSAATITARLPEGALRNVGTEPRVIQDVPLELPGDMSAPVTVDPQRVSATVRRKATVLENYVIRTMVVRVAKPAAVEGRLRVSVDPVVLNNVEVAGPPEVIAQLASDQVQAFAVLDVPGNVTTGQRRGTLRIELPAGVRLVDDPPTIDYEVSAIE